MNHAPFSVGALAGAFVMAASPAAGAQLACDTRDEVTGHLARKYGEEPAARGVANNGALVELLRHEDGRTWTLVITFPNGMACLLAAGEDWEALPDAFKGERT